MTERLGCLLIAAYALLVLSASTVRADSAVRSASPDGEATVYVLGNFSGGFDVAYRAVLRPAARNASWATLGILLVGSRIPGPGASVGVAADPPRRSVPHAFTYVIYPGLQDDYRRHSTICATGCVIELRGDARTIRAYVNGTELASWSRSDLYLAHPYVQLNAEVHAPGDAIFASLTPVRASAGGRLLPHPACAFTTRGIEPSGTATLTFQGETNDAAGTFVNLSTGKRGDKC